METIFILLLTLALAVALAKYMAIAFGDAMSPLDRVFGPVERLIDRLVGVDSSAKMTWMQYARAVLWTNLGIGLVALGVFVFQGWLPFNPDGVKGMSWDLALHTAASFVTNTNQQHYSGQAQLSYLSQMVGVTALQFITPASGFAVMLASLRLFFGKSPTDTEPREAGNFYRDVTRALTRLLIPLSIVWALLLASQGVPSTFEGAQEIVLVDSSPADSNTETPTATTQKIPVGPVAAMVAIKQLGTNGGGWYGPNSSVPLENPTPITNLLQTVAILLVPLACVLMVGAFTKRKRLGWAIFGVMAALSLLMVWGIIASEQGASPVMEGLASGPAAMEGKEVRFGVQSSALWGTLTTQTSNGSVNSMHDSMNPLSGVVLMMGMFINSVWGGIGVGLLNHLLFLVLTVFLAGLMVGRSPELDGRKLTAREIKIASVAILATPLLILVPLALAFACPTWSGLPENGDFHVISQALYEYASAFANNGSGFEGLADGNIFWNVTCSVCLVLGRFIPMFAPLAIAGGLAMRRASPQTRGSLRVDSGVFALTTLSVIVIVQALNFLPMLVLGPIGEHFVTAPQVTTNSTSAAGEGEKK